MDKSQDSTTVRTTPGETIDAPPRPVESEQVRSARNYAALQFRSVLVGPNELGSPLGLQFLAVAQDMLQRLEPRDPVEEMLVAQMVWVHARAANLVRLVTVQKHIKWSELYGEQLDRSMNLFRRQMLALTEYRQPRKRSFTAIRQANIAGQQQVVNGEGGDRVIHEEKKKAKVLVEPRGAGEIKGNHLQE